MQAGGHRFDPDRLHQWQSAKTQTVTPEMKTRYPARSNPGSARGICPLFDIVNGFLIDAATRAAPIFSRDWSACVAKSG